MPRIVMRVISPDVSKLVNIPTEALKKAEGQMKVWGGIFKTLYLKTVETWKKKPSFDIKIEIGLQEMVLTVSTANRIYKFLHDGTRVRYAFLSEDFKPKTTPRLLGSGPGAGKVLFVGRGKFSALGLKPGPGIEAREWTQEMIAQEEKNFLKSMEDAFFSVVPRT